MTAGIREQFEIDLQSINDQLVEMTRLVGSAMSRSTTALLDADVSMAESVIAADEQIDALHHDLEERSLVLIARQAPVATDLRTLIAALRMSADLERMGDLARHVAKLARMRYPSSAVPAELRSYIVEMGHIAQSLVMKTGAIIARRDVAAAEELDADDDEMDRVHRELFGKLLSPEWSYGIEAAVDITLLSRYYERFGDHAVGVARRVVFLVTGDHAGAHGEPPAEQA